MSLLHWFLSSWIVAKLFTLDFRKHVEEVK